MEGTSPIVTTAKSRLDPYWSDSWPLIRQNYPPRASLYGTLISHPMKPTPFSLSLAFLSLSLSVSPVKNKRVQVLPSLFNDYVLIFNKKRSLASIWQQEKKKSRITSTVRGWDVNSSPAASRPSEGEVFLRLIRSRYHGGGPLPWMGKKILLGRKRGASAGRTGCSSRQSWPRPG